MSKTIHELKVLASKAASENIKLELSFSELPDWLQGSRPRDGWIFNPSHLYTKEIEDLQTVLWARGFKGKLTVGQVGWSATEKGSLRVKVPESWREIISL